MTDINAEFVERYQVLYEKDPASKVFAPLAEAYRKMGLLDQALQIAEKGVEKHPNFPSGRLSLAKIYLDFKRYFEAREQLQATVDLSPENILAHSLLAETLLRLKEAKEALKAYKMVLFLNPNDVKAQNYVSKLESLTADEYEDEVFEMKPPERLDIENSTKEVASALKQKAMKALPETILKHRRLERALSLIDAYLVRNDIEKASVVLEEIENIMGVHPEIEKRKALLAVRFRPFEEEAPEEEAPSPNDAKVRTLERLLHRINERRASSI